MSAESLRQFVGDRRIAWRSKPTCQSQSAPAAPEWSRKCIRLTLPIMSMVITCLPC